MDPLTAGLLGLVLIIFCVSVAVHLILYYSFPVKGTTNLPRIRGIVRLPIFGHTWVFIGKSMTGEAHSILSVSLLFMAWIIQTRKVSQLFNLVNVKFIKSLLND